MYNFEISNINELDLERIIKTNEDAMVYATIIPCKNDDLLLISNVLLSSFESGPVCTVAGQTLAPSWGGGGIGLHTDGTELVIDKGATNWMSISNGMAKRIGQKYRRLVAAELRAALMLQHKVEVGVLQFIDDARFV